MNQDVEFFGLALFVCINVFVQLLNCVRLFVASWTVAHQASLSFTIYLSLLKLVSIESVMPSNHLMLWCPLLLLLSIFHRSGSFPMYWLFKSGGWRIGASVSDLPMNIQGWFSLGLTGLMSLLSKGLYRVFSSITIRKHWFFGTQTSLWSNFQIHTWLPRKHIALTVQTFVGKVMPLLFNMLSKFVIAFLPRSKRL